MTGPADAPVSCETYAQQAETARQAADWPEAERLCRKMRVAFPHAWSAYSDGATALYGLGRHDEARLLLSEAAIQFPQEVTFPLELGRLAMGLADWPAAETHWRTALTFAVRPWWVYTELALALEKQGRLADAEAMLLDGRAEFPHEVSFPINYARLAEIRQDWSAAVTRLADAFQSFPPSEPLSAGLYQALMRLADADPAAADAAYKELGLTRADTPPDIDKRSLMLRFESLGGTGPAGGCEFGGVQRHHGAEPLGLFRWATVQPSSLIACLEGRFQGMGDADAITVFLHQDLWEIGDKTYGTSMHSFVSAKDVPHDRMLVSARKRMCYLKEKLIADLEDASKIFVLKVGDRHVTEAETEALGRALRSYGPGMLLCVCPADATHPVHAIMPAAPGVYVGYIDFSGAWDLDAAVAERRADWEALCLRMLDMRSNVA